MLYYTSFVSAILKAARLGGDVMEQKQLIQYLAEKIRNGDSLIDDPNYQAFRTQAEQILITQFGELTDEDEDEDENI